MILNGVVFAPPFLRRNGRNLRSPTETIGDLSETYRRLRSSPVSWTGFPAAINMATVWPSAAMLLLTLAMTVGGSEGSTASGLKIVRVVSLVQGIRERIREPFLGNDSPREIDGEQLGSGRLRASHTVLKPS